MFETDSEKHIFLFLNAKIMLKCDVTTVEDKKFTKLYLHSFFFCKFENKILAAGWLLVLSIAVAVKYDYYYQNSFMQKTLLL